VASAVAVAVAAAEDTRAPKRKRGQQQEPLTEEEAAAAAAEAQRVAAAEGLLLKKASTSSGYKGVYKIKRSLRKPFEAQINPGADQGGKMKSLGVYSTAEEAALAFARAEQEKRNNGVNVRGTPLSEEEAQKAAEEAMRQAAEEGLQLEASATGRGFKGVSHRGKGTKMCKPYHAQINVAGENTSLGAFATAEEAALAYARAKLMAAASGL